MATATGIATSIQSFLELLSGGGGGGLFASFVCFNEDCIRSISRSSLIRMSLESWSSPIFREANCAIEKCIAEMKREMSKDVKLVWSDRVPHLMPSLLNSWISHRNYHRWGSSHRFRSVLDSQIWRWFHYWCRHCVQWLFSTIWVPLSVKLTTSKTRPNAYDKFDPFKFIRLFKCGKLSIDFIFDFPLKSERHFIIELFRSFWKLIDGE